MFILLRTLSVLFVDGGDKEAKKKLDYYQQFDFIYFSLFVFWSEMCQAVQ